MPVKNRQGLNALRPLADLRICEARMNGSLDVQGDMLGFAGFRPGLHDRHPLDDLRQWIGPLFIARRSTGTPSPRPTLPATTVSGPSTRPAKILKTCSG